MKSRLGLLALVPVLSHISTQKIRLHPEVCGVEPGCYDIEKIWRATGKILRNHNFSKQSDSSAEGRTKNFHILNHNLLDACSAWTCPLSVPCFPALSPSLLSLSPAPSHSLFSHFVSCTSTVFKVQTTKARLSESWGCYWSTDKEKEREGVRESRCREEDRERTSLGRPRRSLQSSPEPEGLFQADSVRHYWAEDTQDTQDEEKNDSRKRGREGWEKGDGFKFSI